MITSKLKIVEIPFDTSRLHFSNNELNAELGLTIDKTFIRCR